MIDSALLVRLPLTRVWTVTPLASERSSSVVTLFALPGSVTCRVDQFVAPRDSLIRVACSAGQPCFAVSNGSLAVVCLNELIGRLRTRAVRPSTSGRYLIGRYSG